jgi:Tol biopolymer transport system component
MRALTWIRVSDDEICQPLAHGEFGYTVQASDSSFMFVNGCNDFADAGQFILLIQMLVEQSKPMKLTVPRIVFLLSVMSCGSVNKVCAPGKSESCVGVGGCPGGQVCKSDGSGFELCGCSALGGGNAGGSAGGFAGGSAGGNAGGSTAGGSNTGGSNAGGSAVGGGFAGGNTAGGTAGGNALGAPKVVFQRNLPGNVSVICAMNPDGTNVRVLSDTAIMPIHIEPNVSADGKKIVFLGTDFKSPLMTMDSDGRNVQQITSDGLTYRGPSLSPDGTKIACTAFDSSNNGELVVINADGTGRRVIVSLFSALTPRWSPDGTKIIATHVSGNFTEVITVNSTGLNNLATLVSFNTASGGSVSNPSYSRDGQYVYFARGNSDGTGGIYKMQADGSNSTRLSVSGAVEYEPILAPNGKLYFTKEPQGVASQGDIYVFDPVANISTAMNLTNSALNERYASFGGM